MYSTNVNPLKGIDKRMRNGQPALLDGVITCMVLRINQHVRFLKFKVVCPLNDRRRMLVRSDAMPDGAKYECN